MASRGLGGSRLALILIGTYAQSDSELRALFASWKTQNNKYYSIDEEEYRFSVFVSNYKFIQGWNSAGNTAVLGLNIFADLTNEEFASMYTGSKVLPAEEFEAIVQDPEDIEYPSDWNWYPQAVTGIKNQLQCGSCWAFASVAVSESAHYFSTGNLWSFSEQQVVDCSTANDGCNGGYPSYAIQYIAQEGLELSEDYPYQGVQGTCQYNSNIAVDTTVTGPVGVSSVSNSANLISAIYQQPVVVLVEADQSVFQLYTSGVITNGCGTALDHAITAVGYTPDYFIIKNSWGTSWGQQGFVWISTDASINGGYGACGILTAPVYAQT